MYWQEGRYTFNLNLHEATLRSPYTQSFVLVLSKDDIESLRANSEQFLIDFLTLAGAKIKITPRWSWVYPKIERA